MKIHLYNIPSVDQYVNQLISQYLGYSKDFHQGDILSADRINKLHEKVKDSIIARVNTCSRILIILLKITLLIPGLCMSMRREISSSSLSKKLEKTNLSRKSTKWKKQKSINHKALRNLALKHRTRNKRAIKNKSPISTDSVPVPNQKSNPNSRSLISRSFSSSKVKTIFKHRKTRMSLRFCRIEHHRQRWRPKGPKKWTRK